MGCDIHMYAELKRNVNEKEVWVNVDDFRINPYWDGSDSESQFEHKDLHGDRNYGLFSLLAGVRDYSEKTKPVSDPKGLPEDISDFTKRAADRWESDAHTHSWLLLSELKEFQEKNPTITRSGLISPSQAKALDERGEFPNSWCQGTSDKTFVKREWTEPAEYLKPLITKMQDRMKEELWIWDDDYDKSLDKKIRIVFWFDN
jgi:hypothetical protein